MNQKFQSAVKATTKGVGGGAPFMPHFSQDPHLLCRNIWDKKVIPKGWSEVPKEAIYQTVTTGVASHCCPSQLRFFCRISQEHDSFRRGGRTTDQSGNIIERCPDGATHSTLSNSGKLLVACVGTPCGNHGVPPGFLGVPQASPAPMKMFYHHLQCSVIINGKRTK